MNRNRVLTISSLATAATLALSACVAPAAQAPAAAPAAGAATAAPAAPAAADPNAKTLRILYWQAPTILNYHQGQGTKDADASRLGP